MIEKNKNSKLTAEHLSSFVMLALLFLYMYALNFMMPLHRDDYEYALIWGTYERIAAWPDVFHSLYLHYFDHGGRMVAFLVLDSFLLMGKEWFDPFNAFLYVALMVLIYWHSQRSITWRFNPYILALIFLFCWLGLPDFALVNIWMTGACVYLLTAVIILAFLLPYHFNFWEKPLLHDSYGAALGMFAGGIVAGWTIENTAATMNLIIVGFIIYAYKKKTVAKWMYSGFGGAVLGFVLLIIAPGNFVRSANIKHPLIYNFTNQIAAFIEIALGLLPVILFIILIWRILLAEYGKGKGVIVSRQGNSRYQFMTWSVVKIGITAMMLVSYQTNSFFSQWFSNLLYDNVAVKLGVANSHLKFQLFHALSELEIVIVFLLTITQIYNYAFEKLTLTKKDIKEVASIFKWREVMAAYPGFYFVATLVVLALINNLAMIASPTFPGRAGFGSAVFVIIGAVSAFTIPQIYTYLLGNTSHKKYIAMVTGLIIVPMAAAALQQHVVLYQGNTARMVYVEEMVSQGATYLELEPLPLKNRVLRHVYFSELNNGVSKGGFCRYYRLKDIKVLEKK